MRFGHRLAGSVVAAVVVAAATAAGAQETPAPSGGAGDLTGNLPAGVWLLLVLVVVLAVLTALALTAGEEPGGARRRQGGVSRALAQRDAEAPPEPPPS